MILTLLITPLRKKKEGYYERLRFFLGLHASTYEGIWVFRRYLEQEILPTLPESFHTDHPPATEDHAQVIEASRHPVEAWVREQLYEGKNRLFKPKVFFKKDDLWAELECQYSLLRFLKNKMRLLLMNIY